KQLLDECVPNAGQTDLRGWEWHYLKRQCDSALKTIPSLGTPTEGVGVAFSPDDRHVAATGYSDGAVRIWNAQTGDLEKTLLGLKGDKSDGLAYSPDGTRIASSTGDFFTPGDVIIWDATNGKEHLRFPDLCGAYSNVAFSPDGKRLAVVSGEWNKSPRL